MDAATFAVAAFTISRLRVSEPRPDARAVDPTPWRTQMVAGLVHLRATRELPAVLVAGAVAMAISGLGVAAQYSLVDELGQPPAFLGVLTAALGAGSIIAGLSSARMMGRLDERRLALLGLLNFAGGTLLRATGWLPAAVVGSVVLGFALPCSVLAAINLIQRRTPAALQGRVAAVVTLALFAPQPLTQAVGAAIIGPLGYRGGYLLTAAAVLITAAWLHFRAGTERRRRRHARLTGRL